MLGARRLTPVASAVVALLVALPGAAQEKPPLTVDDYGGWKTIASVDLSPDGSWMTYGYEPLEGDDTLFVKSLDGNAVHAVPRGSSPAFSDDGRWVGYLVAPPEEEGEGGSGPPGRRPGSGAEGERTGPPPRTLVLRHLATGDSVTFADVASFSFPANAGVALVRKRGPGREAEHEGADLVVHSLDAGTSLNLGNVSDFGVNEPGSHLAYLVDAEDDAGNGLYLLELATGTITPLDTEAATYAELAWNEDGDALAALRGSVPDGMEQRANALLVLDDPGRPAGIRRLDPAAVEGFPEGFVLSELGGLRWSDDGRRIFLGIKEQGEERKAREGRADVDVWHWNDVDVQSIQKVRAERERNRTWDAVVNVTGGDLRFVRLADEALESVSPAGESRWGVGRDPHPYEREISWGGSRADYWRVDLETGERTPMAEGIGRQMGTSPDGQWWLFLRDEEVLARRLATGDEVNLTAATGIDFVDRQDDHPYELPVYGVAGWSEDGDVLLYDRFDVWVVPLDGGEATSLTGGLGARDGIRFRVTEFRESGEGGGGFGRFGAGGRDEPIDLEQPVLLDAYGERTKKGGFWRVERGGEPEPLLWVDEQVGRPLKADAADRIVFTRETFVQFPDYWVSDTDFDDPRRVTDANPQQDDFAWSPGRVLIDYVDDRGNELQATLGLPAGYVEGERYPMLVYFYETMSERHHSWQGPRYDDRPHMASYASNGYLVLQPDIVYTIGKPGSSALDDLTAAVEKAIELGYADPDRIGLQGHSWGGYQSSFVVTQTDLFSAVVTGAPPTNLVSFYNTLYKRIGSVQQGITEVGQVRMGTTPFEDFDLYVSQSPVHQAENISTPFMILHGTDDGAVDWLQGLEYYNMARRLGKEVILVSYPGEPHHLDEKDNQIDFQIRMMQFFDHHLRDAPAAKWMVDGVDYVDREYADVREMVDGSRWGKAEEAVTEEGAGGG
ncbi:MAG: prolyl oligopeptidase family serine peptidase [Gemmatimonadota bacterium]|jgi:dienelactone hydrolase